MKYEMTKPCSSCPFRREGFIPLRPERVEEIAGGMLCSQGTPFACHKTTGRDEDGDSTIEDNSQHCGGGLIFAEKNGTSTQMMRIMERIGLYDASKLAPSYDLVFDDVDEMVEAHSSHPIMNRDRTAGVAPARKVEKLTKRPKHVHAWKVTRYAVIPGTRGNSGKGRTGPRERACACGEVQVRKARKWVTKEKQ